MTTLNAILAVLAIASFFGYLAFCLYGQGVVELNIARIRATKANLQLDRFEVVWVYALKLSAILVIVAGLIVCYRYALEVFHG